MMPLCFSYCTAFIGTKFCTDSHLHNDESYHDFFAGQKCFEYKNEKYIDILDIRDIIKISILDYRE